MTAQINISPLELMKRGYHTRCLNTRYVQSMYNTYGQTIDLLTTKTSKVARGELE